MQGIKPTADPRRRSENALAVLDDDHNNRVDIREIFRAIWRFGILPLLILGTLAIVINSTRAFGVINIGSYQLAMNSVIAALLTLGIIVAYQLKVRKLVNKVNRAMIFIRAYTKMHGNMTLEQARTILASTEQPADVPLDDQTSSI